MPFHRNGEKYIPNVIPIPTIGWALTREKKIKVETARIKTENALERPARLSVSGVVVLPCTPSVLLGIDILPFPVTPSIVLPLIFIRPTWLYRSVMAIYGGVPR